MDEELSIFQPEFKYESVSVCKCLIESLSNEQIVIPARKLQILSSVTRTENYLKERRIPELIRFLLTKVITEAPNKPMDYLEKLLDDCMLFRAGHGPAPVLYERRHLEAVVKSFDPGQRGWLSAGQIRRVYITLDLTPPELFDEKTFCETILNDLEKTQEMELFTLLSAGANKSPIVRNVVPYQPHHEALADRLVLFVIDGLRAESFVNYSTMTYLREIANSHGRWGISHTRMPTESRPGHVAVIAGFYEDPSAIVKGWKENPVDFDSVFNQTAYTWCWGTYDILEIFTKGTVDSHIHINKMDPYDQTFSADKNTTLLDNWVFEKVRIFFQNARSDKVLYKKLHQKKIMFFLHLLGTDTSGHTHKPKSLNFLTTVKFVDENIKEVEKLIREFYHNDERTTFLMTSDHGMTDWGSHGAGLDHETQTPYVIWGAGVEQVEQGQLDLELDSETNGMSLKHRVDINQADLAPLMSTILSIPVPVNSVGQLPSHLLNMSLANRAKAIYSNSRQLASQYNTQRLSIESNVIQKIYKPYKKFNHKKYQEVIEFTEKMLTNETQDNEDYEKLILLSTEVMHLSLSGLNYYHNYYQKPLLVLVTLSFIGWIGCLLKSLTEQRINSQVDASSIQNNSFSIIRNNFTINILNAVFLCLLIVSISLLYVQNLPHQYYIYVLMPIYLWWNTLSSFKIWILLLKKIYRERKICTFLSEILFYILGSIAMGISFTYRWMLSIPILSMGLWPYLSSIKVYSTKLVLFSWTSSCILLSIFAFMPTVGKDTFIELVLLAGSIWSFVVAIYIWKFLIPLYRANHIRRKDIVLTVLQLVLLILSLQNILVQSKRFENGTAVSQTHQALAWIIAATSVVMPLIFSRKLICRLMAINTSILNFYLLLSVSHEGLFMVALIFNMTCWICIEFKLMHLKNVKMTECTFGNIETSSNLITIERSISNQDFRRAFYFTVYIILAFFGTGNIASLNSFEIRWVTCFITSFKPFIITGLILLKTLSPFLIVACSFRAIQLLTKAPTGYLVIIVLIYSNIMGILLLYNVKNTGSWLDIGMSISQFVIVQVITLFIVLIHQLAKLLTDINIYVIVNKLFGKSIKKYV
ncbi:GPI ethanolamine phosphate transferase 1-like [Achroia grisella]|uniref:GPI ethanolamine phosphate transferase 1-like n=1 Tax=Achroia grisella TaxID=688607 RepID=UPI0027D26B94|nr:GPI ethanolamine phosphate transferase 1-like [Achroia grisella]